MRAQLLATGGVRHPYTVVTPLLAAFIPELVWTSDAQIADGEAGGLYFRQHWHLVSTVDEQDPSIDAEEAEAPQRQRRDLPPVLPGLWAHAHHITFLGFLALVAVVFVVSRVFELKTSLAIGITLVVLLGGAGLTFRGIGELKESKEWKALGYFMGALAYLATALVALVNGLAALLAS